MEGEGGKEWESGISRGKPLYIGWINHKSYCIAHVNYIQCPLINHNGKEYNKENICVCITESLCCTTEINIVNHQHLSKIKKTKLSAKHGIDSGLGGSSTWQ